MGDEFGEHLALAAADVLRERDLFVFGMRYGLLDGDAHTLEEIGKQVGLTRERIRQLVNRSIRRIRNRGLAHLRIERVDSPCAELVRSITNAVEPGEPEDVDRLWKFAWNQPPQTRALTRCFCRAR